MLCKAKGTSLTEIVREWRYDKRGHRKLASDGLGSQMKKPQLPRSLACLLYTIKQGVEGITYSLDKEGNFKI